MLRPTRTPVQSSQFVAKPLGASATQGDTATPQDKFAPWDHVHPTAPAADNTTDFATAALRWAKGYFTQLRPGAGGVIWTSGAGTPEGSVTAAVGSLYTRSDGGASTTLYVKETGTGNTGWVAK
jgi:hypothetical protein